MSTPLSYCPTCKTYRPTVVASSDLERGAHDVTCWDACSCCGCPVNPPSQPAPAGDYTQARAIAPRQPGEPSAAEAIRRLRDGEEGPPST